MDGEDKTSGKKSLAGFLLSVDSTYLHAVFLCQRNAMPCLRISFLLRGKAEVYSMCAELLAELKQQ